MPFTLHIIIVGAGLGGLSAAIALRQVGHSVTCIEGAKELSEVGAGIQVPPNATRLLAAWGAFEAAQKVAVCPSDMTMRKYSSGAVMSRTSLNPTLCSTYGYPYWLIHRAEYQKVLYRRAVDVGAKIVLGARVESLDVMTQQVWTEDGRVFQGDIIIGADGIRSRVRDIILHEKNISPEVGANCIYRVIIPASKILEDPSTADLIRKPESTGWAGHEWHVVCYPVQMNGEVIYNVVASMPGKAQSWSEPSTIEEIRHQLRHFDSSLLSNLLRKVTDEKCTKWTLGEVPILPTWFRRRVVLIGDAAHAMRPYLGQGAAQALEDAATLGVLLSNVEDIEDLNARLELYEKVRQPRVERIRKASNDLGVLWHLPDGVSQVARDGALQATDHLNPNPFSNPEFQSFLYGHDAILAARTALEGLKNQQKETSPSWKTCISTPSKGWLQLFQVPHWEAPNASNMAASNVSGKTKN